jgi:hypothetical protein
LIADFPCDLWLFLLRIWLGILLEFDDYFRPGRFGNIGDEMLDVELVLVDLFLDFLLNLGNSSAIVLALQLSAFVVIIAEQTLLSRADYLLDLYEF